MAEDPRENRLSRVPPLTVPTHRLTRYLRVRLGVSEGVVLWEVPRTLLGLVPIGVRRIRVPVGEVRSLRVFRTARPLNLVIGLALVVVPLAFGIWWAVFPGVIVGIWIVLVSLGPLLELATHTGTKHRASVCFTHQLDADLYMSAVEDLAGVQTGPESSAAR